MAIYSIGGFWLNIIYADPMIFGCSRLSTGQAFKRQSRYEISHFLSDGSHMKDKPGSFMQDREPLSF